MRRQQSTDRLIPIAEFLEIMNQDGWNIRGGSLVKHLRSTVSFGCPFVVNILGFGLIEEGRTLEIETAEENFNVQVDRIYMIDKWTIELRHLVPEQRQRKKIDGGGWHEVMVEKVVLRIYNHTAYSAFCMEQKRLREESEAEEARLQEEHFQARRLVFIQKLKEQLQMDVEIEVQAGQHELEFLQITFPNGFILRIEMDGGDLYDAYFNVNGICIRDFRNSEDRDRL